MGRKNWLFAGTLAGGQRAAVITNLIQSKRMRGRLRSVGLGGMIAIVY